MVRLGYFRVMEGMEMERPGSVNSGEMMRTRSLTFFGYFNHKKYPGWEVKPRKWMRGRKGGKEREGGGKG